MNRVTRKIILVILTLCMVAGMMITSMAMAEDTLYEEGNRYPIVLVHGFMGWGRDELLGFKYWGGFDDIQEDVQNHGFEVYTATVGPVSSNWDRACELYAYIKGGTVDYGKAHSEKYGHERYGRTYPGLYPIWGEFDSATEAVNKIHLIGHSMGGQTVRTLVQLLEEGSEEERAFTNKDEISPLFKGKNSWVHSITSISSPHDGTTAADEGNDFIQYAKDIISSMGTISGADDDAILDFKLDQWGLKIKDGEMSRDYIDRVWNSSIWDKKNKDFSLWDLSTRGAMELNEWVKTQPNVYYFSWTTEATIPSKITGHQIPDPLVMNPLFYGNSFIMGKFTRDEDPIINESWWSNDGYVNVISQSGPKLGVDNPVIVHWSEIPSFEDMEKGVWNHMPVLESVDHEDIIGRKGDGVNIPEFYRNLCNQLMSLPGDLPIHK